MFYGLGKFNCWASCFHPHLLNIRLWKDKFSRWRFQKISRTLHRFFNNEHLRPVKMYFPYFLFHLLLLFADVDELLLWYDWQIFSLFHSGPLSEMLTITNLWHATCRIWTFAGPEFRLCWMKLCNSDNHYTRVPQTSNWRYLLELIKRRAKVHQKI